MDSLGLFLISWLTKVFFENFMSEGGNKNYINLLFFFNRCTFAKMLQVSEGEKLKNESQYMTYRKAYMYIGPNK
jgi:hypothetical protein